MEDLLQKSKEQLNLNLEHDRAPDGRYQCRYPGCPRSFKFDGKTRWDHELSHGSQDISSNKQKQSTLLEMTFPTTSAAY